MSGQVIQLVQMSPDALQAMLNTAIATGVEQGLLRAKDLLGEEQPVNKEEAMKLSGYADEASFRNFCKVNKIYPAEKRGKYNYYLPSHIKNAQRKKGIHLT